MAAMSVDGQAIVSAERCSVLAILQSGRTADAASRIARDARSHADWLIEGAKRLIPPGPIACREGCAFCCYLQVITTIPEVFEIAEVVRDWAPAELASLFARIEVHRARISVLSGDARRLVRIACPLLVDDRCSVYSIRPMSCRGWNSLDVQGCEAHYVDPTQLTRVPIYGPQHQISAYIQEGMTAGLMAAGLPYHRVELVAALRIALETPDALARWLEGEAIFEAASVRERREVHSFPGEN